MTEVLRTNDPVLIGYVQSLLADAGIEVFVLDRNISALEGAIGAFPCRIAVSEDDIAQARRVLSEADLGQWLSPVKAT